MKNLFKISFLSFLFLGITLSVSAQNSQAKSPALNASGEINGSKITVKYSAPSVRGRKIWGELVPLNQVWRTGANEATTIEFSKDVLIEGKKLAAGKYALFTIPSENEWTIIFNKDANQWGAYNYKESSDALRVKVKPNNKATMTETLALKVNKETVSINWEKVEVSFNVK